MFRKLLPTTSLILLAGIGTASAADATFTARVEAAAAKLCGPVASYNGSGLFYPQMYKAENAACVRLVSRAALAKFAATSPPGDAIALK
jgi:hypothetical protein